MLKRFTRCRTRSPPRGFSQVPERFNCSNRFGSLATLTHSSVGRGRWFGMDKFWNYQGHVWIRWQNSDAALHSRVLAASEELTCGKGPNEAREKDPRVRTHHSLTLTPKMYSKKAIELSLALRKSDKQLTVLGHWLDLIFWPNGKIPTTDRRMAIESWWCRLVHLTPALMTGAYEC